MDTDEIEAALRRRADHHEAALEIGQTDGGGWSAAFRRPDGTTVLSAAGSDRETAVRALYELDELDDLRGG
jgi:hypothetical protein